MSKKKDRPWQIPRIEIDEHVGRWQAAMVQDFQGLLNEASDVENDTVEEKERDREKKGTYDPEGDPRPDVYGVRTEGAYDLGRGGGEPRPIDCGSEKDACA